MAAASVLAILPSALAYFASPVAPIFVCAPIIVPLLHAPLPPFSVLQAMMRGILEFSCRIRFCSCTSAAVPGL